MRNAFCNWDRTPKTNRARFSRIKIWNNELVRNESSANWNAGHTIDHPRNGTLVCSIIVISFFGNNLAKNKGVNFRPKNRWNEFIFHEKRRSCKKNVLAARSGRLLRWVINILELILAWIKLIFLAWTWKNKNSILKIGKGFETERWNYWRTACLCVDTRRLLPI